VPPCVPLTEEGSPTTSIDRSPINDDDDFAENDAPNDAEDCPKDTQEPTQDVSEGNDAEDDDGFGDFDEFEEGGEGDDDFGDFDDGFQQGEEQAETTFDSPQNQTPVHAPPQAPPGPVSAPHLAQTMLCFRMKHIAMTFRLTMHHAACP
jgi:hypothetical protein